MEPTTISPKQLGKLNSGESITVSDGHRAERTIHPPCSMFEHDWSNYTLQRNREKGEISFKRRCTKCDEWDERSVKKEKVDEFFEKDGMGELFG